MQKESIVIRGWMKNKIAYFAFFDLTALKMV